jgi:hypothetical protein
VYSKKLARGKTVDETRDTCARPCKVKLLPKALGSLRVAPADRALVVVADLPTGKSTTAINRVQATGVLIRTNIRVCTR